MRLTALLCSFLLLFTAFSAVKAEDKAPKGAEVHEFQAEVNRLMDIIINALYSNKDIFLRELISNASDALDKIRFLGLTDKDLLGQGDDSKLDIHISVDKENGILTIADKGIGMTKEELVSNLGTVARSGTAKFLEAAHSGDDALSLIGQFGVGFYSAYLVADRVVVASKKSNDSQYIWESTAENTFSVYPDPEGNTLGKHGTKIMLHMKDDATEYLDADNLKQIIQRYSEFIDFPIYLQTTRTVKKEVPVEDHDEPLPEDAAEDAPSDDEDVTVVEEEDKPKTKTVEEKVKEWSLVNDHKPIWTRSKDAITNDEYKSFYKSTTKESSDPMTWTHFKAEGGVDFTALMYIPGTAPSDLYDRYYQKSSSVKLYVRRVLIADQFEDFLPRYLNFVKGVVDSDDLPINVSRETLQKNKVLQVIGKRLVRNILRMLETLANKGKDKKSDDDDAGEESSVDKDTKIDENTTYEKFWNEFGRSIKLGVLEDQKNKNKLVTLLRFYSTKSGDKLTSFEEYVERMQDDQQNIYYISGESLEAVKKSPMLEELKKRDLEVLYFVDALDEYMTQALTDFDGYTLQSVNKEGLTFGDKEEKDFEKLEEEYKPLTKWFEKTLGKKVEKVKLSKRIRDSPAVVVTSQYGWSANMERIMKAQALASNQQGGGMSSKKTLEINPHNPLIVELKNRVDKDPKDPNLKNSAELIFDSALMSSGFVHDDPLKLVRRIHSVLSKDFGVDVSSEVEAEEATPKESHDEEESEAVHDEL